MNESAEVRAGAAGAAARSAARTTPTRPMLTLLKREVWEHAALWIAPLVVTAALLIGAIFGRAYGPQTIPISIGNAAVPQGAQVIAATFLVAVQHGLQVLVMFFVIWFYAAACLYNERRDRSILFWKSMPVSDAKTVSSKYLIALVAEPIYVYIVALLTTLVAAGIFAIRGFSGTVPLNVWDGAAWVRAEGFALEYLVLGVLWYAPITAYLLFVSAWARRNVQLWALSPLVPIIVERIAFGTHHLWAWLLYRLLPDWQLREQWFGGLFRWPFSQASGGSSLMEPLRGLENVDLWIGLAVAAALFYATVRIRGYRDDT